ncbi:MAG: hypothetical protein LC754_01425 [Acidobacteria bacterium]|nr:hypothetical protein [Acidobacteriota bacterium]
MQIVPANTLVAQSRSGERGAALITVMLISMLLLMAGGSLIAVTSMSAANAADATAESQAYYAAEAGTQAVLGVLRGNAAPNPLFNATTTDAANKISFLKAVTRSWSNKSTDPSTMTLPDGSVVPYPIRLSSWLPYDATYTDRVTLSPSYSLLSGIAYAVESVGDPDFSSIVTYSTSGTFDNNSYIKSYGNSSNGFTITYNNLASTVVNTGGGVSSTNLGGFTISAANGSYTLTNAPFNLVVSQTTPWASTATIKCTISGTVTKSGTTTTVALTLALPSPKYNIEGVVYTVPLVSQPLTATSTTLSATVTAPEPRRILVKVRGYGPRGAIKRMQMLLGRYAFNYSPAAAITIRSHDDNTTAMTFNAGNSVQYDYNGNDKAGGTALPAFTVTSTPDYNLLTGLPAGQVLGNPAVQKVSVSSLASFLQTTDGYYGARSAVDFLRKSAMKVKWPLNCTGLSTQCDRYFASGETPSDFGATQPNGLLTFVDGDVDLPLGGGAGMLIVTGKLTMNGSSSFNGLVLVLGGGNLDRSGGGNGNSLGSMVVASFGSTGNFTAPIFNSSGSGNSSIRYDSDWVRRALTLGGPVVLSVSEY